MRVLHPILSSEVVFLYSQLEITYMRVSNWFYLRIHCCLDQCYTCRQYSKTTHTQEERMGRRNRLHVPHTPSCSSCTHMMHDNRICIQVTIHTTHTHTYTHLCSSCTHMIHDNRISTQLLCQIHMPHTHTHCHFTTQIKVFPPKIQQSHPWFTIMQYTHSMIYSIATHIHGSRTGSHADMCLL